jgi:hypothetical protein
MASGVNGTAKFFPHGGQEEHKNTHTYTHTPHTHKERESERERKGPGRRYPKDPSSVPYFLLARFHFLKFPEPSKTAPNITTSWGLIFQHTSLWGYFIFKP